MKKLYNIAVDYFKRNKKRCVKAAILVVILYKASTILYHKFSRNKEEYHKISFTTIDIKNDNNAASIIGYANITSGNIVAITAEISAEVEKIFIKGHSSVRKGQPIIKLKDSTITSTFESAKGAYELAESGYKAAQEMFAQSLISSGEMARISAEYFNAKANFTKLKTAKDKITITAPFDGTLLDIMVSEGQYVNGKEIAMAETRLFTMLKKDIALLHIPVQGRYISKIAKGQRAEIACNENYFDGVVDRFENAIDPKTGYFVVTIKPGKNGNVVDGDSCTVKIKYNVPNSVFIPGASIVVESEETGVKIIRNNKVEFVKIDIISDENGNFLIKGLQDGDLLVTSGASYLKTGDSIDVKELNK